MPITKIDLPSRNWDEFRVQGIAGRIIKTEDYYRIEVEIGGLSGEYMYYAYTCPFPLNDSLVDRLVIGDIGAGGFNIRILCVYEFAVDVD